MERVKLERKRLKKIQADYKKEKYWFHGLNEGRANIPWEKQPQTFLEGTSSERKENRKQYYSEPVA